MKPPKNLRSHLAVLALLWAAAQLGCGRVESPTAARPPILDVFGASGADATARQDTTPEGVKNVPAGRLPVSPPGLPGVLVPKDNPVTPEKVELGKLLFFDKRLSRDGTVCCATCHNPQTAWADHEPVHRGPGGQGIGRNAPTLLNVAYAPVQFWDGRTDNLEDQVVVSFEDPKQMNNSMDAVIAKLRGILGYEQRFHDVFHVGATKEGVAEALAAFERTILSGNSPYDRFRNIEPKAMSEDQQQGGRLFNIDCAVCHTPPLFSGYAFFGAGIGMAEAKPDQGRGAVTGREVNVGEFRVPPLRDVASTAPYFHDGSAKTLEEAVALMAAGGKDHPSTSLMMRSVRVGRLSQYEQKQIVEFLKGLCGQYPIIQPPELPQSW